MSDTCCRLRALRPLDGLAPTDQTVNCRGDQLERFRRVTRPTLEWLHLLPRCGFDAHSLKPRLVMYKSMGFGMKSQAAFLTVDTHPSDKNSKRVIESALTFAKSSCPKDNTRWQSSLLFSGSRLDSKGSVYRDESVVSGRPVTIGAIFGGRVRKVAAAASPRA